MSCYSHKVTMWRSYRDHRLCDVTLPYLCGAKVNNDSGHTGTTFTGKQRTELSKSTSLSLLIGGRRGVDLSAEVKRSVKRSSCRSQLTSAWPLIHSRCTLQWLLSTPLQCYAQFTPPTNRRDKTVLSRPVGLTVCMNCIKTVGRLIEY